MAKRTAATVGIPRWRLIWRAGRTTIGAMAADTLTAGNAVGAFYAGTFPLAADSLEVRVPDRPCAVEKRR